MPFQFYCPQGHLLEGHESQMGQQSQCPFCGSLFMIPVLQVPAAPAPGMGFPGPMGAPGGFPGFGGPTGVGGLPGFPPGGGPVEAPPPEQLAAPPEPEPAPEPKIFRIACPQGHELQTPSDMLGQQALCPYCNAQFELKYENSVEYREEQEAAARRRVQELNKFWLTWAIRASIGVGLLLAGMIVYMVVVSYQ